MKTVEIPPSAAPRNAIVLGVMAGTSGSALEFAAATARRDSRPLHLVHVLQLPSGEAYAGVYGGALEQARTTLDDALDKARRHVGADVPVTGEVIDHGWVVEDLVRSTTDDQLLVLEHRALGSVHRLFSGSIVQSVAGRANVPVASVPEGWTPRTGTAAVVTAAVQDATEAPALLRLAFEQAHAMGASLVVLHAWWLASGYDVVVVDNVFRAEWTERSSEEIEPHLRPLRAEFPDVEVFVAIRHAPPLEAVLDAAGDCDLMVLGRRHHRLPLGSHLGPVARAALGHATTPVLITPELPVVAARGSTEPSDRASFPFVPTF